MRKTSFILSQLTMLVLLTFFSACKENEKPVDPDPGTDDNDEEEVLVDSFKYNDEMNRVGSALYTIDEEKGLYSIYFSAQEGIEDLKEMQKSKDYLYIQTNTVNGEIDFTAKGNEVRYRNLNINSEKINDYSAISTEITLKDDSLFNLQMDIEAKNGDRLQLSYDNSIRFCARDAVEDADVRCTEVIQCFYNGDAKEGIANYYLTFSDVPWEVVDNNIALTKPGHILSLDLYVEKTGEELTIPEGRYKESFEFEDHTYNPQYTAVMVQDEYGMIYPLSIAGEVQVEKDGRIYTLSARFLDEQDKERTIVYSGELKIDDATQSQGGVLPLIGEDTNVDGYMAEGTYFGNMMQSDTGMMNIVIKDRKYQEEEGQGGFAASLTVFTQLFPNMKYIAIVPGIYEVSKGFEKMTWMPGLELDAMGMIIPFGTYVQKDDGSSYGQFSFGSEGTITIEDSPNGYRITYDVVSADGKRMTGSFEGEIPITDLSNDDDVDDGTSTLLDDHDMNLSAITTARLFPRGEVEGPDGKMYSHHRIDIGSRGGWDMEQVLQKGDIFSMDLIVEHDQDGKITPGEYLVSKDRFPVSMKPGVAIRGHFITGGEFDGTTWMHFRTDKNDLYIDGHVCAYDGKIIVEKSDLGENYYTFTIDVICVRKMHVRGTWTGPVINAHSGEGIQPNSASIRRSSMEATATHPDRYEIIRRLSGMSLNRKISK